MCGGGGLFLLLLASFQALKTRYPPHNHSIMHEAFNILQKTHAAQALNEAELNFQHIHRSTSDLQFLTSLL